MCRSGTETPGRTYSFACLLSALLVLPDIPVFSLRGEVAVIRSPSGRSKTSGINLSKVALIEISSRMYSPH